MPRAGDDKCEGVSRYGRPGVGITGDPVPVPRNLKGVAGTPGEERLYHHGGRTERLNILWLLQTC